MECITAWRQVIKVSTFVKEEGESGCIYSYVVLRYTIELHYKSLKYRCVTSNHLCGGVRARQQLKR